MKHVVISLANMLSPAHAGYTRFANIHSGKTVRLCYEQFTLQLCIHQSGVIICHDLEVDCSIAVNFEGIMKFMGFKTQGASITLTGDRTLGHAFNQLLALKNLNSQLLLYHWLPPSFATLAMEAVEGVGVLHKRFRRVLKEQLHNYLVYETGLCAGKPECDEQYHRINKLKWQSESIAATLSNKGILPL